MSTKRTLDKAIKTRDATYKWPNGREINGHELVDIIAWNYECDRTKALNLKNSLSESEIRKILKRYFDAH